MGSEEVIGVDTQLHEAVRYGDLSEVRAALKEGHDPNQIGIYQWSCVHEAANNGDYDILKLLLRYGGNPNKQDLLKGCSAVHYAASESRYDCLKLLLDAGGRFDVCNSYGETCLDVSKDDKCSSLLRTQRDHDIIIHPPSNTSPHTGLCREDSLLERSSQITDDSYFDEISITSGSTDSGRPHSHNWGSEAVGLRKDIALGSVQLSFEYNSKTQVFKIRIWSVYDLLLPPADTSMISTIYVKSYLHPDKRKETKRKTEEIKVDPAHIKDDRRPNKKGPSSHSTVFKPSTFKFSKPLEYKNISSSVVREKMVNIDVCVTQKYSWKSFVVASLNMPLKTATKKLLKERYALSPRLSTNLPENMKVYSAKDLQVIHTNKAFSSIPDLRYTSVLSLSSNSSRGAASDSGVHLSSVGSEVPRTPSIEINMTPEEEREEEELQDALRQIAVMEERETTIAVPIIEENKRKVYGETNMAYSSTSLNIEDTSIHDIEEIKVHVPKKDTQQHAWDSSSNEYNDDNKDSGKSRESSFSSNDKVKVKKISPLKRLSLRKSKSKVTSDSKSDLLNAYEMGEISRPESPSWDGHVEALMVPVEYEYDEPHVREYIGHDEFEKEVGLPIATNRDLPGIHSSSSGKNKFAIQADVHVNRSSKTSVNVEDEELFQRQSKSPARTKKRLNAPVSQHGKNSSSGSSGTSIERRVGADRSLKSEGPYTNDGDSVEDEESFISCHVRAKINRPTKMESFVFLDDDDDDDDEIYDV